MIGKILIDKHRDYITYEITKVCKANYICDHYHKINKETLKDKKGHSYRFATDEEIKNIKRFNINYKLSQYKENLKTISDTLNLIKDNPYLELNEDLEEDLQETLYLINLELKEVLGHE